MRDQDVKGWRRDGDVIRVDWAGDAWTFGFTDGRAGLLRDGGGRAFLALVGLAAVGRRQDGCFTAESLVEVDVVQGRLLVTFRPAGWHELTVRAGWGLSREGRGMDLEVQAATRSVGKLSRLEVLVEARPADPAAIAAPSPLTVAPRDRPAAGSTYDGRESDDVLKNLTTLEVGKPADEDADGGPLQVIAHPHDVARAIADRASETVRHAFFGYDLERGVVLRGRLRAVVPAADASRRDERDRFLAEPPPLRTN